MKGVDKNTVSKCQSVYVCPWGGLSMGKASGVWSFVEWIDITQSPYSLPGVPI